VRRITRLLLWLVGVRVDVAGAGRLEPGRSYVVVANHGSLLDAPAVFVAMPGVRFVAAAELFDHRLLGPLLRRLRCLPVDRSQPRTAYRSLVEAVAALPRPFRLVVFPEGGLRSGVDPDFKAGAFGLAVEAGADVVPVAIRGAAEALPPGRRMPRRGRRIVVEVLEPIAAGPDRRALRALAQRAVTEALAA
jgi:1-acyl-sn-glycerol-3-phosphate acyltransferase